MHMSPRTELVLQTALALPAKEQIKLIDALIAAGDEAAPQPLGESWTMEIRRRAAEYDAGQATPIPWSVVRERARRRDKPRG
jgi:putative addiction module component (TIGR02574 family)